MRMTIFVLIFSCLQIIPVKTEPLEKDNAKLLIYITNQTDTAQGEKTIDYSLLGESKSSWEGYKYSFYSRKITNGKNPGLYDKSIIIVLYQSDITLLNVLGQSLLQGMTGKRQRYNEKIGFITLKLNELKEINNFLKKHLNEIDSESYPKGQINKTTEFKYNFANDLNFGLYYIYLESLNGFNNITAYGYISIGDLYFFMDTKELKHIQELFNTSIEELSSK
jgi:hypothetical protein